MLLVVILRNTAKEKLKTSQRRVLYPLPRWGYVGVILQQSGPHRFVFHELGDKRPLHAHFDLIAGTSTGLIACALSNPNEINLETREIVNLYLDHGPPFSLKGHPFSSTYWQLFSQKYDDISQCPLKGAL